MREEEIVLRYFAFKNKGLASYRTPLKFWLNDAARDGRKLNPEQASSQKQSWESSLAKALAWFEPGDAFRRPQSRAINRAQFDLVMQFADGVASVEAAKKMKDEFRKRYEKLLANNEFSDLISRSVDHTKRTKRRFEMWDEAFAGIN